MATIGKKSNKVHPNLPAIRATSRGIKPRQKLGEDGELSYSERPKSPRSTPSPPNGTKQSAASAVKDGVSPTEVRQSILGQAKATLSKTFKSQEFKAVEAENDNEQAPGSGNRSMFVSDVEIIKAKSLACLKGFTDAETMQLLQMPVIRNLVRVTSSDGFRDHTLRFKNKQSEEEFGYYWLFKNHRSVKINLSFLLVLGLLLSIPQYAWYGKNDTGSSYHISAKVIHALMPVAALITIHLMGKEYFRNDKRNQLLLCFLVLLFQIPALYLQAVDDASFYNRDWKADDGLLSGLAIAIQIGSNFSAAFLLKIRFAYFRFISLGSMLAAFLGYYDITRGSFNDKIYFLMPLAALQLILLMILYSAYHEEKGEREAYLVYEEAAYDVHKLKEQQGQNAHLHAYLIDHYRETALKSGASYNVPPSPLKESPSMEKDSLKKPGLLKSLMGSMMNVASSLRSSFVSTGDNGDGTFPARRESSVYSRRSTNTGLHPMHALRVPQGHSKYSGGGSGQLGPGSGMLSPSSEDQEREQQGILASRSNPDHNKADPIAVPAPLKRSYTDRGMKGRMAVSAKSDEIRAQPLIGSESAEASRDSLPRPLTRASTGPERSLDRRASTGPDRSLTRTSTGSGRPRLPSLTVTAQSEPLPEVAVVVQMDQGARTSMFVESDISDHELGADE
eukprot:Colp12_sorted_trinity150504_noHs@10710